MVSGGVPLLKKLVSSVCIDIVVKLLPVAKVFWAEAGPARAARTPRAAARANRITLRLVPRRRLRPGWLIMVSLRFAGERSGHNMQCGSGWRQSLQPLAVFSDETEV